jgi:hypothetical protein
MWTATRLFCHSPTERASRWANQRARLRVAGDSCGSVIPVSRASVRVRRPRTWLAKTEPAGEQKTKYDILAGVKRCRVSFVDSDGVEHAVELDARTLYEAVGLAIDRFRRCEHVSYDPKGMHEFVVESREASTQHRLPRNMFDAWLRRPGGSPADVARKGRLKELLGVVA